MAAQPAKAEQQLAEAVRLAKAAQLTQAVRLAKAVQLAKVADQMCPWAGLA